MLTLTRQGLLLSLSATVIPSQGSSDVPVAVVNDINTYVGYTLEPRVGYYLNGIYKSTVCTYDTSAKTFSVPAEAFKQIGIIDITLALIDNANANHIETCQTVHATVNKAPLGTVVLPDQTTWQDYVNSYMNQLFDSNYKPQFDQIQQDLENLVTEAQQQQQTAEQQQTQIDNAISVMGEYQIVSNDPVQIQFKKGDGTYGPTVDLGDGLASKSMVNAGYYQSIGSQYSGAASDYGIQVEEIVGAYSQETTTGKNLFDISKITTKEYSNGTGIVNNGDGTLTVTNSAGNSGVMSEQKLSDVCPSLQIGETYVLSGISSGDNTDKIYLNGAKITWLFEGLKVITQEMLDSYVTFYADSGGNTDTVSNLQIEKGNIATAYEPYTGGAPSPNPDYAQEMQAVEISELKSSGKNMFDYQSIVDEATDNGLSANAVVEEKEGRNCLKLLASASITELMFLEGRFKENTQYKFSFTGFYSGSGNGLIIQALYIDGTNKYIYLNTPDAFQKIEMTTDPNKSIKAITFSYGSVATGWLDLDSSYIVELSEDTSEFPGRFVGDTVTLSEPLILRALPNGVADSYEDDVITRRVGEVVFDGSSDENWQYSQYGGDYHTQFMLAFDSTVKPNQKGLCDKLKSIQVTEDYKGDADEWTLWIGTSAFNVYVPKTETSITDVSQFKTWLQSNPITVWYQLATPTTEQLAIPTLQSFYPFTNARCDSIVQPQITWNVLTGKSSILDGNGNLIQQGYMTPQDNLLINSDFKSGIINQKGQTEYTNTSYTSQMTVDGWFIDYGKVNVYANSVYFDNTGSTEYGYKHPLSLPSDTYTFYLDCAINGSARVFARNLENEEVINESISGTVKKSFTFTNSLKFITIIASSGTKISFNFMKLEKGSFFTGMPPWNLSVEILKCQRYLFSCHKISGYGFETGGGNVYIYVNIPTPMQKRGTVSVNSTVQVIGDGSYKTLTISSVNVSSQDNNLVILSGVISEAGNINIVKVFEFTNFTLDAYDY